MVSRTSLLVLLLGIAACDGRRAEGDARARATAGLEHEQSIVTDSTAYSLRPDGPAWTTTIGFTYRAPVDTVYVVNCNGAILMDLQKREAGEWTDAWYAEGNACLSPPVVVPPGGVMSGEIRVWGAESGHRSFNTFRVSEIDGEYRLVWHQPVHHYRATPRSFGDTLPLADRVSNVFTLKRSVVER